MAAVPELKRNDEANQDRATVLRLRRGIGVIGTALPLVLLIGVNVPVVTWVWSGSWTWLGSMSGSYYTHMGNIFVASMCAIGIFLICYRNTKTDDRLSTAAGTLAIMVAIFPTKPHVDPGVKLPTPTVIVGYVHLGSAMVLFVLLAIICLTRFTRLDLGRVPTPGKLLRNRIYRICGWLIVAGLAGALISFFAANDSFDKLVHPVFWFEAMMVIAFGFAWLVKADWFILAEPEPELAGEPEQVGAS